MSGTKNKNRGFIENTSIYMISTFVSFAVPILALPVYTRYLSPSDFGIIVLFVMFGSLSTGFISVSLHFASYRYYFKYKQDLDRFKILNSTNMLFLLLIFILSGIIIYFSSDWFSSALFDGQLTKMLIQWSFVSGCLGYFILYMTTLLTAQVRAIQFTLISISQIILNTIFSFYFIFQYTLTYMARIYAILLSQGIIVFFLFLITRNLFEFRFSLSSLKKSIKLTYPLIPNSLIGIIQGSFDKTMLNMFTGTISVGYYSFGERFAAILKMVTDSVQKVWGPFFMDKAHKNTQESKQEIIDQFYKMAFFFMVVGVCVIYFSEEMIKLLTTKEFYPAMYVTPIYVYFYLFAVMGKIAMEQISFSEKMIYLLPATIGGVIINVIMNLILIPKFGAVGAAGATAVAALFINIFHLYYGMKLYPLPLGKIKLATLYLIVIGLTILVYPIMAYDMNIILKIFVKIIIIISFIFMGIKLKYIDISDINKLLVQLKFSG